MHQERACIRWNGPRGKTSPARLRCSLARLNSTSAAIHNKIIIIILKGWEKHRTLFSGTFDVKSSLAVNQGLGATENIKPRLKSMWHKHRFPQKAGFFFLRKIVSLLGWEKRLTTITHSNIDHMSNKDAATVVRASEGHEVTFPIPGEKYLSTSDSGFAPGTLP